jgi:dihydroflavonol-4-reductase
VRALVLPGEEPFSLRGARCEIFYGDITDSGSLREIFQKEQEDRLVVIHSAAMVYIKRKPNPNVFRVNVEGTKNILEKCLETDARLVYVNNSIHAIPEVSDGALAAETSYFSQDAIFWLYAKSKAEAARIVLESVKNQNLNAAIVQPSGIIGPGDYGDTHMTELIPAVAKGRLPAVVKVGYDSVDVRDVAG